MAVVDVALNAPKVGVEVAVISPEELVERRELMAVLPRVKAPALSKEDVATPPK